MTYELAKKLKEVGFPWNENSPCGHCGYDNGSNSPTLSELIEACGDEFGWLIKQHDGNFGAGARYQAIHIESKYITPEEAVANLWLAVNKK